MKNFLVIIFALSFFSQKSFSQFSFSAGPSLIKPFGIQKAYPGFHLGAEFSNDDVTTMYARFSFMPAQKGTPTTLYVTGVDFNVDPYNIEVSSTEKFNYSMLEFGKRYYFGEGYESGFGVYGGSNMSVVFNKVKNELGDYDHSKYQSPTTGEDFGTIIGLALGLNAGVKNSFYFGTLYFDAGLNYKLLALGSNATANNSTQYTSLFFTFNFGIRKDFY
ncbi:MAG: hypothetical protein V4622_00125 [Bacteroidota bacterium]